jgi:hypothetical protein
MAKIGNSLFFASAWLVAAAAWAEPSVSMQADRQKVGLEDTFRVEILIENAPGGVSLSLPASDDFEILSRNQSSQMSYSVGPGGAGVVRQVQKHTLTVRANRLGKLTIPGAVLKTDSGTLTTKPLSIEVVKGRLTPEPTTRRAPFNPFGIPGFPKLDEELDAEPMGEPLDVPHSDSDLFLRATVDKSEAFVGEQVMLSVHLYSRVDLSTVDSVVMPKLDGFIAQDFKSPSQLSGEQRVINGVPYREYLLRQKVLFALKPGTIDIEAPEADITTGLLFAGRRVHRKGNGFKLVVRPLPPGPATNIVGRWRLSRELSQTEVGLGEPLQVRFHLEGRGNLTGVQLPPLQAPPGFKTFDPEIQDKPNNSRSAVGGSRKIEYTLMPQQTGTFTLPGLSVPFFDPEARKYETLQVDPVTITVKPADNGATSLGGNGASGVAEALPKNQLVGGGLKSLRHTARFTGPQQSVSRQPWFLPVAGAPVVLSMLAALVSLIRGRSTQQSPEGLKKKQARAAHRRLMTARKLLAQGSTTDFYAEVEQALTGFLSARLGVAVGGLQRPELLLKLTQAGVADAERERIRQVLETCDLGRYAPGMGEASARRKALDDAAAAMEGWS